MNNAQVVQANLLPFVSDLMVQPVLFCWHVVTAVYVRLTLIREIIFTDRPCMHATLKVVYSDNRQWHTNVHSRDGNELEIFTSVSIHLWKRKFGFILFWFLKGRGLFQRTVVLLF